MVIQMLTETNDSSTLYTVQNQLLWRDSIHLQYGLDMEILKCSILLNVIQFIVYLLLNS